MMGTGLRFFVYTNEVSLDSSNETWLVRKMLGLPLRDVHPTKAQQIFLDFDERRKEVIVFNRNNRWRKRGIAVVPMKYPQKYTATYPVFVCIYQFDGTVAVSHGGITFCCLIFRVLILSVTLSDRRY